MYINNLLMRMNSLSEPIIFAVDRNFIIYNKIFDDLCRVSNAVLSHVSKREGAYKLIVILDKQNATTFISNNLPHCALSIGYKEECIEVTVNADFLVYKLKNYIKWKNNIDQLILELSGACYEVRSMFHISNILKSICFPYFYSVIKYGLIFGM
jgi:hypothetical protein